MGFRDVSISPEMCLNVHKFCPKITLTKYKPFRTLELSSSDAYASADCPEIMHTPHYTFLYTARYESLSRPNG